MTVRSTKWLHSGTWLVFYLPSASQSATQHLFCFFVVVTLFIFAPTVKFNDVVHRFSALSRYSPFPIHRQQLKRIEQFGKMSVFQTHVTCCRAGEFVAIRTDHLIRNGLAGKLHAGTSFLSNSRENGKE